MAIRSGIFSTIAPSANAYMAKRTIRGNGSMLNHPEFQFGELFVPWNVTIGALGFLNAWLVVTVMEYTGLSRYVWHLPLFFVGLVVLSSSLIGMAFSP